MFSENSEGFLESLQSSNNPVDFIAAQGGSAEFGLCLTTESILDDLVTNFPVDLLTPFNPDETYEHFSHQLVAEGAAIDVALAFTNLRVKGATSDHIEHISHDFRTPLSIMKTELYLAKRVPDTSGNRARTIKFALDTYNHRLNQYRDYKNFKQNGFNPNYYIPTTIEANKDILFADDSIEVCIDGITDISRIHEVGFSDLTLGMIGELVKNAKVHGRVKGRELKVGVDIGYTAEGIQIHIVDDGAGIEPDQIEHILKPSYKNSKSRNDDSLSRSDLYKIAGAGFGLTIVNKIVKSFGGNLQIVSKPDQGTRVSMLLPYAA